MKAKYTEEIYKPIALLLLQRFCNQQKKLYCKCSLYFFLAESFVTFYKCQERWKIKTGGKNPEEVRSIYFFLSLDCCFQDIRMLFVNKWQVFRN